MTHRIFIPSTSLKRGMEHGHETTLCVHFTCTLLRTH